MSEWISVKDRLPEPFVDVLVWCENLAQDYAQLECFRVGEFYAAIDRFCVWEDGKPSSFRTDRFYGKVTHWMPLPEPPK